MTTPKDTWISVNDAMPDIGAEIIVINALEKIKIADACSIGDGGIYFLGKNNKIIEKRYITHWMLLSKPKTK